MLFEEPDEHLQGDGGGEDPRGAAGALFFVDRVGRGIAAEDESGVGVEGQREEGVAVFRPLGDGLAEEVGVEQAARHVVQGDQQVLQGDGGGQVLVSVQ